MGSTVGEGALVLLWPFIPLTVQQSSGHILTPRAAKKGAVLNKGNKLLWALRVTEADGALVFTP